MAYERKTIDTWELQLNYGYGWEYTLTEYTRKEARERIERIQREPAASTRHDWLRRELERRRLRERSNKADSRAD